jgi:8-oxo-dGTP pyrophosphatase MutT (NUDIX family)
MSQESLKINNEFKQRILANLRKFDRREHSTDGLTPAAVAMVITRDTDGHASFIITRRSAQLKNHAGQWALPGGRMDPGETATETALRETREEIGVTLAEEQVLGLLDDYPTRSGFVITPVVVWGGRDLQLAPNEDEVAAAYTVPLRELEGPDVPLLKRIPESDRPVISIRFPTLNARINAPTAALLYQLREVAIRGLETRVDHYDQAVFAWR